MEVTGRSLLELVHPEDIAAVVTALAALEGGAAEIQLESRFLQRDDRWVHLQWVARPVPNTDRWWAAGRNTTEFHRLLSERLELRARLDLALGQATAAMWDLDLRQGFFSWEPQATQILGVPAGAIPTSLMDLAGLLHPDDVPGLLAAVTGLPETGAVEVGLRVGVGPTLRYVSFRGRVLDRDHRGKALRAIGLVLDVTSEKAMEEQMLRMIMSDALTGVPNRRAFDQALRTEWRRCSRAAQPLSLLMIDIDDFKSFNDTFGHLIGDEALCAVARALTATVHRGGDTLARFGGEEFAVVLPNTDTSGAAAIAERMVTAVRSVTVRQAPGRTISISVGTATWHPHDTTLKSAALLARSDQALYAAKVEGKNRTVAYEGFIAAQDAFQDAMRAGLAADEFQLFYQPVIDLAEGDVVGFEALMRWNRPDHGRVNPDDFIPAAEASTLICDLGRWALHEAADQLARWSRDGLDTHGELRVAVNASARHISTPAIVADIASAISSAGITPGRIEVELTETALTDNVLADTHLTAIRALGVSVALDDFGTGYTSVGQLPHLPVDTLKIDRSFVSSLDPRQRGLVRLMIDAAHAFGLSVVAEGVEDAETLQALRDLGCDTAQGFFMGRPMPAELIAPWLDDWRNGTRQELFTVASSREPLIGSTRR